MYNNKKTEAKWKWGWWILRYISANETFVTPLVFFWQDLFAVVVVDVLLAVIQSISQTSVSQHTTTSYAWLRVPAASSNRRGWNDVRKISREDQGDKEPSGKRTEKQSAKLASFEFASNSPMNFPGCAQTIPSEILPSRRPTFHFGRYTLTTATLP